MADARVLLRQQRAARRVEHPQASYSDGGKLLCTVCHEDVRAETLWDAHVRSPGHRLRLQQHPKEQQQQQNISETESARLSARKRKFRDDQDGDEGSDRSGRSGREAKDESSPYDGSARMKRNRANDNGGDDDIDDDDDDDNCDRDIATLATTVLGSEQQLQLQQQQQPPSEQITNVDRGADISSNRTTRKPATPPLTRRASSTPVPGVEVQIPSRPATPVAVRSEAGSNSNSRGSGGASAIPRTSIAFGRSPLIPLEALSAPASTSLSFSLPSDVAADGSGQAIAGFKPAKARDSALEGSSLPSVVAVAGTTGANGDSPTVDEDEWAAFEAEMARGAAVAAAPAVTAASADAVISAPAMSAADVAAAAKSEEEEQARRRAVADQEREDEREEATRALETEFEEMEQLEARVAKLKERREALRRHHSDLGQELNTTATAILPVAVTAATEEVVDEVSVRADEGEDEEDEDGDEGDDDWAGFRFRG